MAWTATGRSTQPTRHRHEFGDGQQPGRQPRPTTRAATSANNSGGNPNQQLHPNPLAKRQKIC